MPNFERIEGKRKGSVKFFHGGFFYKKQRRFLHKTKMPVMARWLWRHSFHLRQSILFKYEMPIWTRNIRSHEKLRVKLKTLQVQFEHLSERINTAGLLIRVGGATERPFRKKELLESEEEEENNAPIDIADDDNYDNTSILPGGWWRLRFFYEIFEKRL